jgi:hypothetical protein
MNHQLAQALLAAFVMSLSGAAAGAGFCVEDADDVLWIDCEEAIVGVSRQTRVLCRRDPNAALTVVEPARRLAPGEGRCPTSGAMSRALTKDGIPRNGDADAPERDDE